MNEHGDLLSIQEVRERLTKGLPLVLNADANWNREYLQTKQDYLENYMAKSWQQKEKLPQTENNLRKKIIILKKEKKVFVNVLLNNLDCARRWNRNVELKI